MNDLEAYLTVESDHEQLQKRLGFVADNQDISQVSAHPPKLSPSYFFQNKDLYLSKHSRFAPYPEHTHQFLEINYVYRGSCKQKINGQEVTLVQGDILLMDTESRHSIESLGSQDLLINLLFQDQNISINWLKQLQGENSLLYQFLWNGGRPSKRENYLLIHSQTGDPVQASLETLMREYFLPQAFSQEVIRHTLPIFFYQLARQLPKLDQELKTQESTYVQVLKIIDREYATISLGQLASRLNFNKNYLSNLITAHSGQTFTQLVTQRKLMMAQLLLKTTQLPIQEIAQSVGFSNKTDFYKKYKTQYGHTPGCEKSRSAFVQ